MALKEVWSELDHKIITDSQGRLKKVQNVSAVFSSIDNILGTRQGERVMLPEFASTLGSMLFEPITQELMNRLSKEIKRVIELWDNRPLVTSVDFRADHDRNYVQISVNFVIRGYAETYTYTKVVKTGGV